MIRAVLGRSVREIIHKYEATVQLFTPDVAFADAKNYLPSLLKKRGVDLRVGMSLLEHLERGVHILSIDVYEPFRQQALLRIGARDSDDWPVLA